MLLAFNNFYAASDFFVPILKNDFFCFCFIYFFMFFGSDSLAGLAILFMSACGFNFRQAPPTPGQQMRSINFS